MMILLEYNRVINKVLGSTWALYVEPLLATAQAVAKPKLWYAPAGLAKPG